MATDLPPGITEEMLTTFLKATPGATRESAIASINHYLSLSAGSSSTTDPAHVYMGSGPSTQDSEFHGRQADKPTPGADDFRTMDGAAYWLLDAFNNHTEDYRRVRAEMIAAGRISPDASIDKMMSVWTQYAGFSMIAWEKGQSKLSPEKLLQLDVANNLANGSGGTTRSVEHSSETLALRSTADLGGDAQTIAQNELGRRVSGKDLAALVGAGHAVDAANPATRDTTTTTTRDPLSGLPTSSTSQTTSTSGAGPSAIGEAMTQQAMQSPEYGAYQAAGHYFPALLNALGAISGVGQ